ncbi:MAG TPA: 4Fe-4S ferredoxin [Deltaproteobacteria bacterium]|nr:4Fe-4S ferredoxin [Deltaproteobacteria bacterium]
MKQFGFYFDQEKCKGCYACVLSCRLKNHLEPDIYWRRIIWVEEDAAKDLYSFISLSCLHCANPPCVKACQVGAIVKREEDGIVLVDKEKCLGKAECTRCLKACPYSIPQFGSSNNAKMEKCDFCIDMLNKGKKPDCVIHCPHSALDAGPIEELKAKYGAIYEVRGFKYSKSAKPSVIFRPKKVSS